MPLAALRSDAGAAMLLTVGCTVDCSDATSEGLDFEHLRLRYVRVLGMKEGLSEALYPGESTFLSFKQLWTAICQPPRQASAHSAHVLPISQKSGASSLWTDDLPSDTFVTFGSTIHSPTVLNRGHCPLRAVIATLEDTC